MAKYAMAIITKGRRFYWSKQISGWSVWHDATHYSEEDRKKAKLPKEAFWVSVLKGMSDNPYPADGVLSDPPAEFLASLPKPKVISTDPKPVPLLRRRDGVIATPELPRTRTDNKRSTSLRSVEKAKPIGKVHPNGGGRQRS